MQKQEQNIKTMSPDSNEALCIRIQQGDEQAKSQLLQQNEGMIHAVAWRERRRYAYLALELEDLWAAGQLGMLRAARLFRPETSLPPMRGLTCGRQSSGKSFPAEPLSGSLCTCTTECTSCPYIGNQTAV